MPRNPARLHPVESLEARVLLAAPEVPDHGAGLTLVEAAIVDNGAEIEVELLPYNEVLRITGSGDGNISINLSQLPASVVNLQISSFASVTLLGDATLRDLVFTEVNFADAGNVSLDRLFTFEVAHLRIATAPDAVVLQGSGGGGSVGGQILLEAERFSSSPDAYIYAWVESLGLATKSHVKSLPEISSFPTQSILLNFQPDQPIKTSTEGQVSVVRGGDFVSYFLSSPHERATLEQLLLIARQSARVDLVPLSALLINPALQAALTAGPETGLSLARVAEGPMLDGGLAGSRSGVESDSLLAALLLATAGEESAEPSTTGAAPDFFLTESDTRPASISDHVATFADASTADAPVDGSGFNVIEPSALMLPYADALAGAATLALTRLGEPLAQMVFDFQGRFATFGDMAAARLSDNLRSDTRPALLVDTRPTRQRDGIEVVSV